jgi:hypothetical protein
MDPDLVRQQEEAEREALAKLAKIHPAQTPGGTKQEPVIAPFAPVYFNTPAAQDAVSGVAMAAETPAVAWEKETIATPHHKVLRGEPIYVRFARFVCYGFAGGMLGGSLGVAAFNYWSLPAERASLAILGPTAAIALVCAFASLLVRSPEATHFS